MSHRVRLLSVLIALITQSVLAEDKLPVVYQSQLAGKDIVLTFSKLESFGDDGESKPQIKARYFYRHIGKTIPLVLQSDGKLVECIETFNDLDCSKPTGFWQVDLPQENQPPERVSAKWQANAQSKLSPVELRLTTGQQSLNLGAWQTLLGSGPTKLVGIKEMNGVTAGFLMDTRSGAKVPQLVSGLAQDVMQAFNAQFKLELLGLAAARLENHSLDGREYDNSSIHYVSKKILTLGGGSGGYYGGAHSVDGYGSSTLDIETGKSVDVRTTFFKHLSAKDVSPFISKHGFITIPGKFLKRKQTIESLTLLELSRFPASKTPSAKEQATGDQTRADCFEEWKNGLLYSMDDGLPDLDAHKWGDRIGFSFEFMPTRTGLAIYTNDTAEANRGCRGVMFVIPWKKVQRYIVMPLDDE